MIKFLFKIILFSFCAAITIQASIVLYEKKEYDNALLVCDLRSANQRNFQTVATKRLELLTVLNAAMFTCNDMTRTMCTIVRCERVAPREFTIPSNAEIILDSMIIRQDQTIYTTN
jgi:hypothetical protein